MVFRRALIPLVCFALLGYFGYHLLVGDNGLESQARLQSQVNALEGELKGLKSVRGRLDRDVTLMRADKLDPDMLDERARAVLNFSHPNEIIIMDKRGTLKPKP